MEIIVWIAFAVVVSAAGPVTINSDEYYETKAACEQANALALDQAKASPGWPEIVAVGTGCAEIKVTEVDHKKAAKPAPKGQKQRDLESSRDPANASPFRTT